MRVFIVVIAGRFQQCDHRVLAVCSSRDAADDLIKRQSEACRIPEFIMQVLPCTLDALLSNMSCDVCNIKKALGIESARTI